MIRFNPSPVLNIYILELLRGYDQIQSFSRPRYLYIRVTPCNSKLLRLNDRFHPAPVLDIYILELLRVYDQIPSFSRPRYLNN